MSDFNMVASPFFMTLPGYPGRMDENEILNDLEYLQQTYPGEVRRCQRRIAEILDKYDYEGSMIYDEYPDKLQLCLMCRRAYEQVMKQEKWEKETYTPEQIREIVEILMYQELMERRGKGRRQQEKTVASCTGLVL